MYIMQYDRPWKPLSRGCTRGGGNRASRLQESVSDIYDYYEYGIYTLVVSLSSSRSKRRVVKATKRKAYSRR